MKLSRLKVNCTSISDLITSSQGNTPPTERQWRDFFNLVNKPVEKLTSKQMYDIRHIVMKQVDYNPEDLSETVIKEMCSIYAIEVFGKYSLSGGGTKPHTLDKGRLAEEAAISFLSKVDGYEYSKNDRMFSNTFFKGIPDIIISTGENVRDVVGVKEVKIPYDYPSFLRLYESPLSKDNSWQLQGYMDILKLEEAELIHCLVDMPKSMLDSRIAELKLRCVEIGITELETQERCDFLTNNMTYDNIPDEGKLIRITVRRNDVRIKEARSRVKVARKWIQELHNKMQKQLSLAKE